MLSIYLIVRHFDVDATLDDFEINNNFSYIVISYAEKDLDEITFHLIFENQTNNKYSSFLVRYNGEMKNIMSKSRGIKQVEQYTDNGATTIRYSANFENEKKVLFFETFSSNLFEDKNGDVKLNLFLDNDILDTKLIIKNLNDVTLDYLYPEPTEKYPRLIIYERGIQNDDYDGLTEDLILLKGNNPFIETKSKKILFIFGVLIAILTSLISSLAIDYIKDKIKK